MLLVPADEFFLGARRFIGSLAAALDDRVPAFRLWPSFAPLWTFLDHAYEN